VGFRTVTTLGLLAWGLGWLAMGIMATPNVGGTPAPAASTPPKLSRLATDKGHSGSTTLSEREVARLLARELPTTGEVPLTAVTVRLPGDGRLEVAGRLPLRALLNEAPLAGAVQMLPAAWTERPVWVRLRARAQIEPSAGGPRRYLRVDVERFWIGRRRLPSILPRILFSPTTLGLLRWPLPAPVAGVRLETGRVVITTASSL
jgi:hypothetical protein